MSALWIPNEEIRFAARTGFISWKLWDRHFATGCVSGRYRKWRLLEERGHFKRHPSARTSDVLVPNLTNADVKRHCGVEIVKPPYLAQILHDELVADGLLTLHRQGFLSQFSTESELRRLEPIRRNQEGAKLPDLILDLKGGHTVAVEMELTQKSTSRYRAMLLAYRPKTDIEAVVFVVKGRGVLEAVLRAADDVRFPQDLRPIGFMRVENWIERPANGRILFSFGASTLTKIASGTLDAP